MEGFSLVLVKKLFALSYDLSTPLTNYGSVPED